MHVLPLEIQHGIFLLACTDGGRTGLAISLTSRSYRDAVRPVRFHSIAVRAFPHIADVIQSYKHDLAELEASGSTLKPRVRHLLLSPESKQPNDANQFALEEESSAAEDEAYTASVVALLQLVGPTLTTLAYTAQLRFMGIGDGVCPMPKLEELTVFLNPCERRSNVLLGPPHPPTSYPALRRPHIVLSWGAVVPELMGWWAEAAPDVTDVRLTNVFRRDGGSAWVETMLDEDRAKRPYRSVRRLFIEPYQKPIGGKCGNPRVQHTYFVKALKDLRKRVPGDIEFVLKGRESAGQPLNRIADVERYWMDGVNGGPGGWRWPDEATVAR
uniref:Cytochrome P450 3A13 n=1 Tax=Ganoderma boninense TaxID=34458 RepID=A0A5K1K402_9APHY|nr:Cytochrome P450 3A13 [Ganoderma boninense]